MLKMLSQKDLYLNPSSTPNSVSPDDLICGSKIPGSTCVSYPECMFYDSRDLAARIVLSTQGIPTVYC
jgi:hypothetical protein